MSREIDALMCSKVMGLKKVPAPYMIVAGTFYSGPDGVLVIESGNRIRSFSPSTGISAAFEAVDKMREKFPQFVLYFNPRRGVFECEFTEGTIGGLSVDGDSPNDESAPMAICLAALRAVGVEVDK